MGNRRYLSFGLALASLLAGSIPAITAQDAPRRGRKYKAPPETSHIEIEVLKDSNSKPLVSAAVVFHAYRDGRDEGNLEVKTNDQGKAIIDVIAIGSTIGVQVIANGYATYAGEFEIKEPTREIQVRMLRPRAQISTYVETHGQASERPVGVQEPSKATTEPILQAPKPTNHSSDPSPLTPVSPDATPGNSQNRTKPTSNTQPTGVPPQE